MVGEIIKAKSSKYFLRVILLFPIFVMSLFFLYFIATFKNNSDEFIVTTPDTILVIDTILSIGDGYLDILRANYLLNVVEQRISVPITRVVSEDGITGIIMGIFTDVTAKQYVCMDVIVKAGIESKCIQIIADSTEFNPDRTIAKMVVVLPAPRINRCFIDYSNLRFQFIEGHVFNTAENTLDFIENSVEEILVTGIEESKERGILEEARTSSAIQVIELLKAVGVEEVRVLFNDSENYLALAENRINKGE